MADDFIALALNKSLDAFKNMLQRAWTVHRKPRTEQHKQQKQERENKKLHRERVWNWGSGVFGLDVYAPQQGRDWSCEHTVQDFGEPQLLRHKDGFGGKLLVAQYEYF